MARAISQLRKAYGITVERAKVGRLVIPKHAICAFESLENHWARFRVLACLMKAHSVASTTRALFSSDCRRGTWVPRHHDSFFPNKLPLEEYAHRLLICRSQGSLLESAKKGQAYE